MAGKPGMHKRLLNPARAEEIRQKIKTSLIIKKLEDHILSGQEMSASQVTAALGLLRKSVPDLASTELNMTGELKTISNEPQQTTDEWADKYCMGTATGASESTH